MGNLNIITKDYPENLSDGIMVCGINFGYSNEDEKNDTLGKVVPSEKSSFFSDKSVNNTKFRNRILTWLSNWGIVLESTKGKEGKLEKRFFQTNWLDTQTKSINSDEKITIQTLVDDSKPILDLIRTRQPKVIIFIGSQLIEALNDTSIRDNNISVRDEAISIMGERSGNAEIHQGTLPGYTGTKFKVLTQNFGNTQIISLPHTASIGISNEYLSSIKLLDDVIHSLA